MLIAFWRYIYIVLHRKKVRKKLQNRRKKVFHLFFACWWKYPDPYLGGPKTYGSGSRSRTLFGAFGPGVFFCSFLFASPLKNADRLSAFLFSFFSGPHVLRIRIRPRLHLFAGSGSVSGSRLSDTNIWLLFAYLQLLYCNLVKSLLKIRELSLSNKRRFLFLSYLLCVHASSVL